MQPEFLNDNIAVYKGMIPLKNR